MEDQGSPVRSRSEGSAATVMRRACSSAAGGKSGSKPCSIISRRAAASRSMVKSVAEMRERSPAPQEPGERKPGGDEADAADRRDGAQPADTGDRQQIEAAGEQHDTGEQQRAGPIGGVFGKRARFGQHGDDQDSERVDEVVEDGLLPDAQ